MKTWNDINRERVPHIKYGERLFFRMYAEFRAKLKARLERVQTPDDVLSIVGQFDPDVNVEDYYIKFYQRTAMSFAKRNYKEFQREAKKDLNGDIRESIWLDHVLNFVKQQGGNKINLVKWHHVEDIVNISRKAVSKGINEGWGIEKIVDNLFSEISEREKWKAMRIARTEVVSASNLGAFEAATASELDLEKIWLHPGGPGPSGFMRDDHADMNGTTVPINEDFILPDGEPMPYPGVGPAHHVINCRCTVAFQPREGGIVAQELGEI